MHGLKSQTVQSRLEAAVKQDSIDTASKLISETLVEACKEAGLKSQNKCFDQECETEKGNLQSLGEKISKNPNNSEVRQLSFVPAEYSGGYRHVVIPFCFVCFDLSKLRIKWCAFRKVSKI